MDKSTIGAALRFVRARLTGRRTPLIVRWNCTNRCSARCKYCKTWESPADELSTAEGVGMLRELRALGTRRFCFSGGEPLMREDIDELLAEAASLRLSLEMNSNGVLLHRHLPSLRSMQLVKVSLDGPRELHDAIRGRPMFQTIMENVRALRREGIRFSFTTTLVRENTSVEIVDELVGIARSHGTFVAFQPLVSTTKWGSIDMSAVAPGGEEMRRVVRHLIDLKRRYPDHIRNSLAGLAHIASWPELGALRCAGGTIFAIVESNGDLYACERTAYPEGTTFPNVRAGVGRALARVAVPSCTGCGFCGALELNFLWNLDLRVWRDVLRVVAR